MRGYIISFLAGVMLGLVVAYLLFAYVAQSDIFWFLGGAIVMFLFLGLFLVYSAIHAYVTVAIQRSDEPHTPPFLPQIQQLDGEPHLEVWR